MHSSATVIATRPVTTPSAADPSCLGENAQTEAQAGAAATDNHEAFLLRADCQAANDHPLVVAGREIEETLAEVGKAWARSNWPNVVDSLQKLSPRIEAIWPQLGRPQDVVRHYWTLGKICNAHEYPEDAIAAWQRAELFIAQSADVLDHAPAQRAALLKETINLQLRCSDRKGMEYSASRLIDLLPHVVSLPANDSLRQWTCGPIADGLVGGLCLFGAVAEASTVLSSIFAAKNLDRRQILDAMQQSPAVRDELVRLLTPDEWSMLGCLELAEGRELHAELQKQMRTVTPTAASVDAELRSLATQAQLAYMQTEKLAHYAVAACAVIKAEGAAAYPDDDISAQLDNPELTEFRSRLRLIWSLKQQRKDMSAIEEFQTASADFLRVSPALQARFLERGEDLADAMGRQGNLAEAERVYTVLEHLAPQATHVDYPGYLRILSTRARLKLWQSNDPSGAFALAVRARELLNHVAPKIDGSEAVRAFHCLSLIAGVGAARTAALTQEAPGYLALTADYDLGGDQVCARAAVYALAELAEYYWKTGDEQRMSGSLYRARAFLRQLDDISTPESRTPLFRRVGGLCMHLNRFDMAEELLQNAYALTFSIEQNFERLRIRASLDLTKAQRANAQRNELDHRELGEALNERLEMAGGLLSAITDPLDHALLERDINYERLALNDQFIERGSRRSIVRRIRELELWLHQPRNRGGTAPAEWPDPIGR